MSSFNLLEFLTSLTQNGTRHLIWGVHVQCGTSSPELRSSSSSPSPTRLSGNPVNNSLVELKPSEQTLHSRNGIYLFLMGCETPNLLFFLHNRVSKTSSPYTLVIEPPRRSVREHSKRQFYDRSRWQKTPKHTPTSQRKGPPSECADNRPPGVKEWYTWTGVPTTHRVLYRRPKGSRSLGSLSRLSFGFTQTRSRGSREWQ